jgi:hypothetical protein
VSGPSSVLEKALAMTAEANRIRKGAEAQLEAARVSQRVDEIHERLLELRRLIGAARRLNVASGAELVDLSGLDEGRAAFARHASSGLPSNQVFTAAKQKLNDVSSRLSGQLGAAWSQWTADRIAGLPLARISLLSADEQQLARSRRDELAKLARNPVPTSADVRTFVSDAAILSETLNQLPDPPQEVLALLERLGKRPFLTLDELTDQQIALLRRADVADQIEVRRRGM